MGGAGGRFYRRTDPNELKRMYAQVSRQTQSIAYEGEIAGRLSDLLAQYNDRDTDKIREYLDSIKSVLQEEIESAIDLRFGGSIEKHTYVDGLSDVDCLIFLRDPALESKSPREVLDYFSAIIEERLARICTVSVGALAVTVEYADGTKIQLLPAIKKGTGFVISTKTGEEWSNIIRPDKFASALTNVNQRCGGKEVPVIKLAKAAISKLPNEYQLTGYHVESLAIEAFKRYSGIMTTKAMLEHFFERSEDLILRPIRDKSGQSLHVDDYIGPRDSESRQLIASKLDLISRRMRTANQRELVDDWLEEIGE